MRARRPTPARVAALWLAHPVPLAAIALLLLNDHLLKAHYANWWTGKLSDVAGLAFAPALVALVLGAVLPRASATRLAAAATVLVGATFAVVKVTDAGAAAASSAWTALAGPSVVLKDRTDLLALPALGLGWIAFRAARARASNTASSRPGAASQPNAARRVLGTLAIPVAAAAVLATGPSGYYNATGAASDDSGAAVRTVYSEDGVSDGPWWHPIGGAGSWSGETWHRAGTSAQECVPSQPSVCYRIVPGAIGVERSDDAGASWRPEWALTDAERRRLWLEWRGVSLGDFLSTGVAILEVDDGYRVYLADGVDGFAVREADGAWRRVGFVGLVEDSRRWVLEPQDIPPAPEPVTSGAWAAGIAWAFAAAVATRVALFGAVAARRPIRRAWYLRWGLAGLGVIAAAACGAYAAAATAWANDWAAGGILEWGAAFAVPLAIASWVVGMVMAGGRDVKVRTGALWWGLASGAVAVAALNLWPRPWLAALATAAVFGAHLVFRLRRPTRPRSAARPAVG